MLDEGEIYEVDSSRRAALDGGHLCAEPDGGGRCAVLDVPNSVALYRAKTIDLDGHDRLSAMETWQQMVIPAAKWRGHH